MSETPFCFLQTWCPIGAPYGSTLGSGGDTCYSARQIFGCYYSAYSDPWVPGCVSRSGNLGVAFLEVHALAQYCAVHSVQVTDIISLQFVTLAMLSQQTLF